MAGSTASGQDSARNVIAPDRVYWLAVKHLTVMDMLNADNLPILFAPVAVFQDDTWARLTDTLDIATARQTCARLAAIHDKPVQDWTRPAPGNLAHAFFMWSAAKCGHVPPDRMNEVPDREPVWGAGWNETDWLFVDGATDAEFEAHLADMSESIRRAEIFNESESARVSASLSVQTSEARRRWAMLHAANKKPAPKEAA